MDTGKLKRFATEARKILMQGVAHRLSALGFQPDGTNTEEPQQQGGGATFMGKTVSQDFYDKWQSLRHAVGERGIRVVAEEAAYTPALCHRLDTGTSGLVLIAKTPQAEQVLTEAIRKREVQKTYLCVTFGRPMPPEGVLGGYLIKDADRGLVRIVSDKQPGAKEVETRYETIAVSGRLALLKVALITGRTHQIRAHMAGIGCPILGDSKYGNNAANRELRLKYQALCAWELTLPHFAQPELAPLSGKIFRAPKPWYYAQVLDGTLK